MMSSNRGPDMADPMPEQVKQFVLENESVRSPFVTSTDVSEQFSGVSKRTIHKRLQRLAERGEIERRKIGANTIVWYPVD